MNKILVTGGAGFIGSHVIDKLLSTGVKVLCIDNFNDYYSTTSKKKNIEEHLRNPQYSLAELDIRDKEQLQEAVSNFQPNSIIHLAACAGVRPSISDPYLYATTNIIGTLNLLETTKKLNLNKFIFASSSSVYGINTKVPFKESDPVLKPVSPYAASKIAGEALCHTYSNLYSIPTIALRFFTVYGPRQRPDLAIRQFTTKVMQGQKIKMFGDGMTARDYTYISDIVDGIISALYYECKGYEVFNLGNANPVKLCELIGEIAKVVGTEVNFERLDTQPGDVPVTYADISLANNRLNYNPKTKLDKGLKEFYRWLKKEEEVIRK